MKHNLLLFILLVFTSCSWAQCPKNTWSGPLRSHQINFEDSSSHIHYQIDTSMPNNIWQVGEAVKPGFIAAKSPINVLQTDTLNPYPVNNQSSVECWNDSSFNVLGTSKLASISFWHHYDVDSLTDSLLVQLTLDSGKHWLGPNEFHDSLLAAGMGFPMMTFEGIRNDNLHPISSHKIVFTGSDTGWTHVSICFTFMGISPTRQLDSSSFGVRFLLKSDSIQNNKPGWEIDDLEFLEPGLLSAVNDLTLKDIRIYPNPSHTGEFRFDLPDSYHPSKIEVYDMFGRLVVQKSNSNIISLGGFANGLYTFKLQCKESPQILEGKIMKF